MAHVSQMNPTRDGRVERSNITRQRILDAARTLMLNGTAQPIAKDIAHTAGTTTRTLFRHFSDMESLYTTIANEAQASITAVMEEPFPAAEDWRTSLDLIIERRVRVYEHLLPLYLSSAWPRDSSDQSYGIKRRRRRLSEVLPKKLAEDEILFEVLDATLSIEFWASMRRGQNLGVPTATCVLQRAVRELTNQ